MHVTRIAAAEVCEGGGGGEERRHVFNPVNVQGGPDSIRQFFIINNQSIQQHTGKWESTFCCLFCLFCCFPFSRVLLDCLVILMIKNCLIESGPPCRMQGGFSGNLPPFDQISNCDNFSFMRGVRLSAVERRDDDVPVVLMPRARVTESQIGSRTCLSFNFPADIQRVS
jgi:hypothetical protein